MTGAFAGVLVLGAALVSAAPALAGGQDPCPPPPPQTPPPVSAGVNHLTATCPPTYPHKSQGTNDPGADASNDPAGLPGTTPDSVTATCFQTCTVSTQLADALVDITAVDAGAPRFGASSVDGRDRTVLFVTRDGGDTKPECPGYRSTFTDWAQFGFQDARRGASYRKTGTFTGSHPVSRAAATAAAHKFQVCFEAPYPFVNRPGYRIQHDGASFDGVLPECSGLRRRYVPGSTETPCVRDRQVVRSGRGWVVRVKFDVPANGRDPKALG